MGIVIDTTQIKIYEYLNSICEYANFGQEFTDNLWQELLLDSKLYEEFIYYLTNHTFKDELKVEGYSLSEIYIWQMGKVNLKNEIGKNTAECNKEAMVMLAFYTMVEMKKNPEKYLKKLSSGWGNDIL